jgi:hypothetical protein
MMSGGQWTTNWKGDVGLLSARFGSTREELKAGIVLGQALTEVALRDTRNVFRASSRTGR